MILHQPKNVSSQLTNNNYCVILQKHQFIPKKLRITIYITQLLKGILLFTNARFDHIIVIELS